MADISAPLSGKLNDAGRKGKWGGSRCSRAVHKWCVYGANLIKTWDLDPSEYISLDDGDYVLPYVGVISIQKSRPGYLCSWHCLRCSMNNDCGWVALEVEGKLHMKHDLQQHTYECPEKALVKSAGKE